MLWSWLIACIGGKAPVELLADPVPEAIARSGGALPALPDDFVAPVLAPWVVASSPDIGPLRLTWRPGADGDSVEVVLDASAVPEAMEYTVYVSQTRCRSRGVEPVEELEFEEGPFRIGDPVWVFRPPGGIDQTMTKALVTFILEPKEQARRRVTSAVFMYRELDNTVSVVDANLARQEFDRRRWTEFAEDPYGGPLGLVGSTFIKSVKVQP
jgi:hypothetical protein